MSQRLEDGAMRRQRSKVVSAIERDPRILQRFWSYVDKNEVDNGCWEWTGRCHKPGYPCFQVGQRCVHPSYISWFSTTGEIPLGGRIERVCDNNLCVRPSHLSWLVGRRTEERLIAEADGYLTLAGAARFA